MVIPVYNGAAYLGAAIDSILTQSPSVTEIIVVDDGSTDASAEVARNQPKVKVIQQANGGVARALNRGIAAATSEYLAFLDADDLWSPNKQAMQLNCFNAPEPPGIVLGYAQNYHSPELPEIVRRTIHCPPDPQAGYVFGTMMLRRDTFTRVGPLKSDWKIGSHIEWLARAEDMGLTFKLLPDVLLQRRLHHDNISRRELVHRPDFVRIIKFVLDRRRQKKPTHNLL